MSEREKRKQVTRKTLQTELVPLVKNFFKAFSLLSSVWLIGHYGYSLSWVLIGLPVWLYTERKKEQKEIQRSIQHEIVSREEEVILARVEDLPSWVFFPDVERAEWLNKMVHQMWPFINGYTKHFLRTVVEPNIQKNLPKVLKGFRFETIDLGDVAPRIGGVKVYKEHVRRDEIIMDMEIFYAGDCMFKVALGSKIRVGVKNFQIHGTVRVLMKPLIDVVPIIGGLEVYFLNIPDVDFDLTNFGNVLDIPGLSNILRKIIQEQVASFVVLPNSIAVPLAPDVDLKELRFKEPKGVLRVQVIEARNLKKADIGLTGKGKSDPYVEAYVGAQEKKTSVKKNTIDPLWNEFFEFIVLDPRGQLMEVEVYDEDTGPDDDDFLGRLTLDLYALAKKGQSDLWYNLEDIKKGELHFRSNWMTLTSSSDDLQKQREEVAALESTSQLSTALLVVFVDSAQHLPNARHAATEPHPMVTVSCGRKKQDTTTKYSTHDPVWEERFVFLINNPEVQDIVAEVKDGKSDKKLGNVTVSLSTLLQQPKMELRQPLSLKESGPDSRLIIWFRLRILKSGSDESVGQLYAPSLENRSVSPDSTVPEPSTIGANGSVEYLNNAMTEKPVEIIATAQSSHTRVESPPPGNVLRQRNVVNASGEIGSGEAGLGRIQISVRYTPQRRRLIIVIHKCANLIPCDDDNTADPYVKIVLLPERATKRKTEVQKNTLNPVFEQSFEYSGDIDEFKDRTLEVTVKNSVSLFQRGRERSVIGSVSLDLCNVDLTVTAINWLWLDLQEPPSVEE